MAASPSMPRFSSPSFHSTRTESPRFTPFRTAVVTTRRWGISSRLNSSKSSDAGGSVSPDNGDVPYQFHNMFFPYKRKGSPVYVMLPVDVVGPAGVVRRWKAMVNSLRALALAGVEGVVIEVWWGLVEMDKPGVYNWQGYLEIVDLAKRCGLKVRIVMAFHQCGTGPDDRLWIPLPQWVLKKIKKDPDIMSCDRFGRRNMEYISVGCDTLPVLQGRSPIQAYTDFMRNFKDTFQSFLGDLITGIQIGMGPAGELRYPSCPSQKLSWAWHFRELGEFQCYDKYMLANLNAHAQEVGMREWGNGGPIGASNLMHNPEQTEFFKSDDGTWNTPYGKFFLQWYSGTLLLHGERICKEAETIFRGTEVHKSAKIAGIHWHYNTQSHPSELTAGYYNTATNDGYLPIIRMLGRYGFSLCSPCFDLKDVEQKQRNPASSPEDLLSQLLLTARFCDVPVEGENSAASLDEGSLQQILRTSKFYLDGLKNPAVCFKFVRMDKNMFESHSWARFTRFVRQMSDDNIIRAKLDFGRNLNLSSRSDARKYRVAFAYS